MSHHHFRLFSQNLWEYFCRLSPYTAVKKKRQRQRVLRGSSKCRETAYFITAVDGKVTLSRLWHAECSILTGRWCSGWANGWWWHTTVLSLTVRQDPKLTPGNKQGRDKDNTFNHSNWSFLDHFILFGVTGWVLEPVPTAYVWRQGTPLNESPAHSGPYVSIWGFSCCTRVSRQCSQGVLAASPTTTTPDFVCAVDSTENDLCLSRFP